MWLAAASVSLLGESNFSYRFVDGCVGLLIILLVYFISLEFYRSRLKAALSGVALLGANMLFHGHGIRNGTQDGMMLLLISVALLYAWRLFTTAADIQNSKLSLRLAICGGLALGLAMLTKGMGGMIAFPILLLYALLSSKRRQFFAPKMLLLCALVLILSLLPLALYLLAQGDLAHSAYRQMILTEGVSRASGGYELLKNSPNYFLRVIFEMGETMVPALLALALIYHLWLARNDERSKFLLVWAVAPVAIHSLIKAKLSWYIMPCLPAMAILAGHTLGTLITLSMTNLRQAISFPSKRSLSVSTVLVLISSFLLYKQEQAIMRVFGKITARSVVFPADTFVRDIQSAGYNFKNPLKIAQIGIDQLGFHEPLYFRMIGFAHNRISTKPHKIKKIGKKKLNPEQPLRKRKLKKLEAKAKWELRTHHDPVVSPQAADIILTDSAHESLLTVERPYEARCSFRPQNIRRHWLVLLIYKRGLVPKNCSTPTHATAVEKKV